MLIFCFDAACVHNDAEKFVDVVMRIKYFDGSMGERGTQITQNLKRTLLQSAAELEINI